VGFDDDGYLGIDASQPVEIQRQDAGISFVVGVAAHQLVQRPD
jgi:hypothetical protein